MQDSAVVHLESSLINHYILEIKKRHTAVFACTYMVPFQSRTGHTLSPCFFSEKAARCREPKPEQRQNVYLGIYLCFLNCRTKRTALHQQNCFLFNSKSKHDRTHEFMQKNRNKYQKDFDLCKKLYQASTDRIIPRLNST